jgi:hypothetical protein
MMSGLLLCRELPKTSADAALAAYLEHLLRRPLRLRRRELHRLAALLRGAVE